MDDVKGFSAFVTARGPALLRLGWLLTSDPDLGEDLAQEALTRLVRHWDRVNAGGNPEAYARTSMRSIWIDSWRRRHGFFVEPAGVLPEHPRLDQELEAVPSRRALIAALAQLTPGQRAVLVLRFYEDLTETATAKALGCSHSTVKSQTRLALARLRNLAPWLAEELGQVPDGRVALRSVDSPEVAR